MADDATKIAEALLDRIDARDREWRDEVRGNFKELRTEVGGIRERLTVMEATAEGEAQSHSLLEGRHQALEGRVVACEGKHAEHAARATVEKLMRGGGSARMPRWLRHTLYLLGYGIAGAVVSHLPASNANGSDPSPVPRRAAPPAAATAPYSPPAPMPLEPADGR